VIDPTAGHAVPERESPPNDAGFRPFPGLGNRHAQTLVGAFLNVPARLPSRTDRVELDDGDTIALEVSESACIEVGAPTIVFVHGLCGCHGSPYVVRIARAAWRSGTRAVRMNLRGCGSGRGLARRSYHSGKSDDLLAVIDHLRRRRPDSPVRVVGFSLGGNIALKLAGELGESARERGLDRVVAICPPVDLARCAALLERPENRIYDRHFVSLLRRALRDREAMFPDLPHTTLPDRLTLRGFDEAYTAPRHGFLDAADYYFRSSSAALVPRIRTECNILFADDDPFIDANALDGFELPSNVRVLRARHGGHLGFIGRPGSIGLRWMDRRVLDWTLGPARS
jgi:predicted alpha/beta-fold hydrolase